MKSLPVIDCLLGSIFLATTASAQATAWSAGLPVAAPAPTCGLGDVNGDGIGDFAYGGANSGSPVTVVSGRDRAVLYVIAETFSTGLGRSLANCGDIDLDGVDDLIVGAPLNDTPPLYDVGFARIYSGRSSALLRQFNGTQAAEYFGTAVGSAGDVDADGIPDVYVKSGDGYALVARVDVFSGASGVLLFSKSGPMSKSFAAAIANAGDVDGDGHDDLVIGSPEYSAAETQTSGRVTIYSPFSGTTLYDFDAPPTASYFGAAVEGLGDVDGDGFDDVAIGTISSTTTLGSGMVRVISGRSGLVQYTLTSAVESYWFGSQIKRLSDYDGDGIADFAIAYSRAVLPGGGTLSLCSGVDGTEIGASESFAEGQVAAIANTSDVNGDGRDDIIWTVVGGHGTTVAVMALGGWSAPSMYCTSRTFFGNCAPTMLVSGGTSCSFGDNLIASCAGLPPYTHALLAWNRTAASTTLPGATLCVGRGVGLVMTPVQVTAWSSIHCEAVAGFTFTKPYLAANNLLPGTTIYAQFWSRDPSGAPPANVGMSNALAITIAP